MAVAIEIPAVIATKWPANVRLAGGNCGIKAEAPDLAVAVADEPMQCAAMFTTNRLQAAPVLLSRRHLARTGGRVRALVVNSGNANCATGKDGMRAALATAAAAARQLGCRREEIFVCSTGVIGVPLPVGKIVAALPEWLGTAGSRRSTVGPEAFAHAILTTDTRIKVAQTELDVGGRLYRVAGACKGSGMIHPRMSTMLAFVFTDAPLRAKDLDRALRAAVERSFNRISVDGDTSTNDTVALFGPRTAGPALRGRELEEFEEALNEVCTGLARQIVMDGEGARRLVTIRVRGARDARDADRAARAIALSSLVKTALGGADPNWGRFLAAAGYSGAKFDPERAEVAFAGLRVYRRGAALPFDEADAKRRLDRPEVEVVLDLRAGRAETWMWTCDLTEEYVRINGSYRS
jgi:glutamate N-acetyltransferase/amino-acid N-acetyltransferase